MSLTRTHIEVIFAPLLSGNSAAFFDNVADDVDWLVTGDDGSHPLVGHWHSKEQYVNDTWGRLRGILQEPMKLELVDVTVGNEIGEGLSGRAVVEIKGFDGVTLSGKPYNNEYCWVMKINKSGKIASVRAYLDTAKLRDALAENEKQSNAASTL